MKCVVESKITRRMPTMRIISLRSNVLSCSKKIAMLPFRWYTVAAQSQRDIAMRDRCRGEDSERKAAI